MKLIQGRRFATVALATLAVFVLVAAIHVQAGQDADGWLGVMIQNIDEDLRLSENLPSDDGVIITRVIDDSPAEKAGLERGDVILKFDDREARSVRRLTRMIEWARPGEKIDMVILRDGKEMPVVVEIGEGDDDEEFFGRHHGDFRLRVPHVPSPPSPPKAYTFSLGQLSGSHIGVSLYELSDQLAEQYGAKDGGALINEVLEDTPAEKAGLKAGDVIVEVDGRKVDDIGEIREIIGDKDDGDKVAVRVLRPLSNEELTIDVEVESRNTWSGVGDRSWRSWSHDRSRGPRTFFWDDDEWKKAMEEWRDSDEMNEWREELREELEDLREELKELQNEFHEKGY